MDARIVEKGPYHHGGDEIEDPPLFAQPVGQEDHDYEHQRYPEKGEIDGAAVEEGDHEDCYQVIRDRQGGKEDFQ